MGSDVPDGLVLDVKRNSLDDGPGIRTAVFLKGCPLSCAWCHNPESKSTRPELLVDRARCIDCGICVDACPEGAAVPGLLDPVDRAACVLCFRCAAACPTNARQPAGTRMAVADVVALLDKDLPFFESSGGGLTLTGGEPTLQMDFCAALLEVCRDKGVHRLLETCGLFVFERFASRLAPLLDAIYVDLKLIDPEQHRRHCGVDNAVILDNLRELAALGRARPLSVLPRVPLVPGVTDTDDNLSGIAVFLEQCGYGSVSLLPYNPTWHDKARAVGQSPAYRHDGFMEREALTRCRSHFGAFELV